MKNKILVHISYFTSYALVCYYDVSGLLFGMHYELFFLKLLPTSKSRAGTGFFTLRISGETSGSRQQLSDASIASRLPLLLYNTVASDFELARIKG